METLSGRLGLRMAVCLQAKVRECWLGLYAGSVCDAQHQCSWSMLLVALVLSVLPRQCYSSEVDSRQNYSRVHTSNLTEFVSASL